MKIFVLGDSFCPASALRPAFEKLDGHSISYANVVDEPTWQPISASESQLSEYLGSPAQVIAALGVNDGYGHDVLVIQGAPVTDAVIAAAPKLKLICVARGGPVNVDVEAATERGIPVVTTPGKNATAVAELTIAMLVMLARRLPEAERYVNEGGEVYIDNYEGANWFGHNLAGHMLGLVGFGHVGSRVTNRALAFEMRVLVYDPFVPASEIREAGAEPADLSRLLSEADYVSLHARATSENCAMIGASQFDLMKPGVCFVNTARDSLVDEEALHSALRSGHVAGAALDIASPSQAGSRHRLLELSNVLMLPHIGGATFDTLVNGGHVAVAEIQRFASGHPLANVVNPSVLSGTRE